MMRRKSVSSVESQATEKNWESFGTNPVLADLWRKPSNRSRWAEFVNPHHDGDAYCNFKNKIIKTDSHNATMATGILDPLFKILSLQLCHDGDECLTFYNVTNRQRTYLYNLYVS